jgi:hypothetical protein
VPSDKRHPPARIPVARWVILPINALKQNLLCILQRPYALVNAPHKKYPHNWAKRGKTLAGHAIRFQFIPAAREALYAPGSLFASV